MYWWHFLAHELKEPSVNSLQQRIMYREFVMWLAYFSKRFAEDNGEQLHPKRMPRQSDEQIAAIFRNAAKIAYEAKHRKPCPYG